MLGLRWSLRDFSRDFGTFSSCGIIHPSSCRNLYCVMVILIFHSWVGLVRFGVAWSGGVWVGWGWWNLPWGEQMSLIIPAWRLPSVESRDFNPCCKMGVCESLHREERWGRLLQAGSASGDNAEMFICSRSVVTSMRAVQINWVTLSWEKQGHGCE